MWATGVAGSLAYNWSRPLPTQLKVIHSRVYAQAITLGALCAVYAVEVLSGHDLGRRTVDKTRDFGEPASAPSAPLPSSAP